MFGRICVLRRRLADSLQSLGTQLHKADGSNQSLIRRAEDETENGRVLSQVPSCERVGTRAHYSQGAWPRRCSVVRCA